MSESASPLESVETVIDEIAIPAFLLEVDPEGELRFRKLNAAHVAAIGLPSDSIRGMKPIEAFPPRVAATLLKNYRTCQLENRSLRYEELLNLKDRESWWDTTLSPMHGADGSVIGVLGIAVDITASRTREFKAAKAHVELEEINENIATFTSMTAHDVRGPLTKIRMLTEATLEGFQDMGDEKVELIQMTHSLAERALGYVEDILGYARSLKIDTVAPVRLDLSHLCHDIAAIVDPEAKLKITKPDLQLECESVILQLVIRNLTENAVRHANSHIAITAEEAEPGVLTFAITNDGDGFAGGAEGFTDRIMMTRNGEGTRGFGLAAVNHILETRKGRLWLGKPLFKTGTTIQFTLPGRILDKALEDPLDDIEPLKAIA